jgi:hypothetical protein
MDEAVAIVGRANEIATAAQSGTSWTDRRKVGSLLRDS